MKFTVERDVLAEAVGWTARSLPLRPTSPVLNGLLIKAESGEVSISSFDHEISAKQTIEASVEQEGTCLVPGKMLAEICRSLPNADVEFVANDSTIFMTCRSAKFQLAGMPVADYPELPELPQISGTVDGAEFAKAVSQVQIAVSKDETLPLLTGIRLEISGSTMTLLATDRYRLAMREITWNPENPEIEAAVLLKAKTMTEVGRTLSSSGELSIALPEMAILVGFSGGIRRTTSVLMDGQYPNLRALFPTETAVHAVVRTSDLAEARAVFPSWQNVTLPCAFSSPKTDRSRSMPGAVMRLAHPNRCPRSWTVTKLQWHTTPRTFRRDWVPLIPILYVSPSLRLLNLLCSPVRMNR